MRSSVAAARLLMDRGLVIEANHNSPPHCSVRVNHRPPVNIYPRDIYRSGNNKRPHCNIVFVSSIPPVISIYETTTGLMISSVDKPAAETAQWLSPRVRMDDDRWVDGLWMDGGLRMDGMMDKTLMHTEVEDGSIISQPLLWNVRNGATGTSTVRYLSARKTTVYRTVLFTEKRTNPMYWYEYLSA